MMKNRLTLLIGILLVGVLLAYMFLFQVRYDEWAVVRTFGQTTDAARDEGGKISLDASGKPVDSGSMVFNPGLYFRWPPPIQAVTHYTRLVQIMDDQLEEQATKDDHVVIIRTYLAWRISDPLRFFNKLGTLERARQQLKPLVRDLRRIFSTYNFNDIVNRDPARVKLAQMEEQATSQLRQSVGTAGYGIEIQRLGIRRILVPEKVTERVFARMRQERERLAADARQSGKAFADAITERAQSKSKEILSFAALLANKIRTEGKKEAAEQYDHFKKEPQLANFLRWLDALEKILEHRTTVVLGVDQVFSIDHMLGATKHAIQEPIQSNNHRADTKEVVP